MAGSSRTATSIPCCRGFDGSHRLESRLRPHGAASGRVRGRRARHQHSAHYCKPASRNSFQPSISANPQVATVFGTRFRQTRRSQQFSTFHFDKPAGCNSFRPQNGPKSAGNGGFVETGAEKVRETAGLKGAGSWSWPQPHVSQDGEAGTEVPAGRHFDGLFTCPGLGRSRGMRPPERRARPSPTGGPGAGGPALPSSSTYGIDTTP